MFDVQSVNSSNYVYILGFRCQGVKALYPDTWTQTPETLSVVSHKWPLVFQPWTLNLTNLYSINEHLVLRDSRRSRRRGAEIVGSALKIIRSVKWTKVQEIVPSELKLKVTKAVRPRGSRQVDVSLQASPSATTRQVALSFIKKIEFLKL
jgi:hypothetical protein